MTVQQLSDEINVPGKIIRVWLREGFSSLAPGQGGRWEVGPMMVRYCKQRAERYQPR